MTPLKSRRLLFLVILSTMVLALPAFAGKRRAVKHPPAANLSVVNISGVVRDSVTGQPIAKARVDAGDEHDTTDAQGAFLLKKVGIAGNVAVTADRTGYAAKTIDVAAGSTQNLTISLVPEATTRITKVDGANIDVDTDSVEFGYLSGFAGYNSATFEEFCTPAGTPLVVQREQVQKFIGPAVRVSQTACCATSEVFRINVELKDGTKTDVYFDDSCSGYSVDVIARNHVSGEFVYVPFAQISQMTFPAGAASAKAATRDRQ
jgi:hypothetical protein